MATPVLHLLAGPNGAGKTTYYETVLAPVAGLPFINADHIAAERWPDDPMIHAREASRLAAEERQAAIEERRSFISETVFSHASKLDLLRAAGAAGYRRYLHIVLIPEDFAVARVQVRVQTGGHDVPEDKIRQRFQRLWSLLHQAIQITEEATVLDNSRAGNPFRIVNRYSHGRSLGPEAWPAWTPPDLR